MLVDEFPVANEPYEEGQYDRYASAYLAWCR